MIRSTSVGILMACLVSCSNERSAELPSSASEKELSVTAPIKVKTVTAKKIDLAEPLRVSGTIAAKQTSNIAVLSQGVVEQIHVRVGDRVTKGQALFRTRRVEYEQQLSEAEALVSIALAESAKAERTFERFSTLVHDGAVSRASYEDALTTLEIAKSQVELRRTQVATAKQALDDTTVRAPFDGAVTARYIDEGVFMANSFSGMGNSAVVQIQECGIAAGILFAPESEGGRLRLGLTGSLYVDGVDQPIRSEIIILNDRVDPQTRTVEFRMAFQNDRCAVRAGQSVRAEIDVDSRPALVLPRALLQGTGTSPFVFLAQRGSARRANVAVRDIDAVQVEVLSGLNESDLIITAPPEALRDGARVEADAT